MVIYLSVRCFMDTHSVLSCLLLFTTKTMEVQEQGSEESSPLSIKQEPASPKHETQSLDLSLPEQLLTCTKSEQTYLDSATEGLDLMCQESLQSHIKEEAKDFTDEIEIGPTVIQASVATRVEIASTCDSEIVENCSRDVHDYQFINKDFVIKNNNAEKMVDRYLNDITLINQSVSTSNSPRTEERPRTHIGGKPYTCDLCNYKTIRKTSLTSHMLIAYCMHYKKNKKYKLYYCNLCDYKTGRKYSFGLHFLTHNEDKLFSCLLCNYKTNQKGNLNLHMRCHTGEKPFICDFCNYKTKVNYILMSHLRTHTGEKPYSCYICGYKATIKRSLTMHARSHKKN